jgi:hypothetical protein
MTFLNLKGKTEQVFKLLDLNFAEDYSVWDNSSKTFMRDGQVMDVDGNPHDVKETKWIKKDEFMRMFPHMNKNNKVKRKVIVDGEEFDWSMPITADRALHACIANVIAMGQRPELVEYKWSKEGEGLATRHNIVVNTVATPAVDGTPQASLPQAVIPQLATPKPTMTLNATEKQIVDAIKGQGETHTFEQVVNIFRKYNIPDDRAQEIFDGELK